jgi:hypothetical protein
MVRVYAVPLEAFAERTPADHRRLRGHQSRVERMLIVRLSQVALRGNVDHQREASTKDSNWVAYIFRCDLSIDQICAPGPACAVAWGRALPQMSNVHGSTTMRSGILFFRIGCQGGSR